MSAIKHTHIYVFFETRKGMDYYKCDDPHCTHVAPRNLIVGKASVCSACRNSELILTWAILRRRRPKCLECANTKEAKDFRHTKDVMKNLLEEMGKKTA